VEGCRLRLIPPNSPRSRAPLFPTFDVFGLCNDVARAKVVAVDGFSPPRRDQLCLIPVSSTTLPFDSRTYGVVWVDRKGITHLCSHQSYGAAIETIEQVRSDRQKLFTAREVASRYAKSEFMRTAAREVRRFWSDGSKQFGPSGYSQRLREINQMQSDDDTVRDIAAEWWKLGRTPDSSQYVTWRDAFSECSMTLIDAWLDGCITEDALNQGVYFAELDAVTK
jgi:hypothetical protein